METKKCPFQGHFVHYIKKWRPGRDSNPRPMYAVFDVLYYVKIGFNRLFSLYTSVYKLKYINIHVLRIYTLKA